MTVMAIVQDVDKCVRCNGCVIACKRTYQLKGIVPADNLPHQKIGKNQRMVIKPQRRLDVAPFVRFSCWHCTEPPCTSRCPWGAIKKDPSTGAVYIDKSKCTPDATYAPTGSKCKGVCQIDCVQGGYIRIGDGTTEFGDARKAQKCTMCYGRASGPDADLPSKAEKVGSDYYSPFFPTRVVAELNHQPACVFTCPARAMYYDTRANWIEFLTAGLALAPGNPDKILSYAGDGNMFWFSRKVFVAPPKADPFLEDHVSPMLSSLLNGPFAKAALVPTLVAGGLLALSARRARIESEQTSLTGGEA